LQKVRWFEIKTVYLSLNFNSESEKKMGENSNQKQCGILGENNVNICDIPEREMTIDQAMEYGFLKHKCLYPDNRPIIEMNLT